MQFIPRAEGCWPHRRWLGGIKGPGLKLTPRAA